MECAVCYCNASNCKLVCGHSFCRQCVKDWYQKGSEQTCPMCRHKLYFKGMYKLLQVWEEERFEQQRDEAFAEAIDQIFAEDEDEELDLDEDGDTLMAEPMEIDGDLEQDEEADDEESVWKTDSEAESESDCPCELCQEDEEYEGWSWDSTDSRLADISDIQDQFNRFFRVGLCPSIFVQAYVEGAVFVYDQAWWEDFPVKKNLFVSKHGVKPIGSRRVDQRLRPMGIFV